jgi:AsmA protein
LSALKKLNASGEAKIGWLKLANVKTENVNIGLKAADGVATISPFAANLYKGSMSGLLKVDARSTPSIAFKQDMKGISIGPLLVDAINNNMLEGKGSLNVDVTASGNSVEALKKALNGKAAVNLTDGAIKGVDIAGTVRDLKSKVNLFKDKSSIGADQSKKTDFSELTATFYIKNGVAHNDDLQMKAPVLRLAKGDSKGDIDIGNETVNYLAKPSIVKSLKGQGGADLDSLAGFSIPVKITGTFSNPKYGMDFASIGAALAKSNLLDKVGGEKGSAVKDLINGGDKVEALKGLLGKKKAAEPVANSATETAPASNSAATEQTKPADAAKTEQPKSAEEIANEKAKKKLNKILGF